MVETRTVHAVVLTGGRSSRMGGRHKPGIFIDGRSIIDRTLSALWLAAPAANVIIAGSDQGLSASLGQRIKIVREDPPFSGPVAGVHAALEAIPRSNGLVILLGGDMPFLSSVTIAKLLCTAAAGASVVSCVDPAGRLQYLCTGWQGDVLRAQLDRIKDPAGVPLRALFDGLHPELIDCDPGELGDIDTPEDLAQVKDPIGFRAGSDDCRCSPGDDQETDEVQGPRPD